MNQDSAKAATLRSKIDVHRPAGAMAAHNPLAASAGFDAIWGSGLSCPRPTPCPMPISFRWTSTWK